jgi:cytochrome c
MLRITLFLFALATQMCAQNPAKPRILIFSKTAGWHHSSIAAGNAAMQKMGNLHDIEVDTTTDASFFYEENLQKYRAVVFLNTTEDVLNAQQQNHFERYIEAGGGFVGIHAASDTEYGWPWFTKLVGGQFNGHPNEPNVRHASFDCVDRTHVSTEKMPAHFERDDEFYNFKNLNPACKILVTIDEKTYEGGTNGAFHPISWYHNYDGGRAFYTAMGHTDSTYLEPIFLDHIYGGLKYSMGNRLPDLDKYDALPTLKMPK